MAPRIIFITGTDTGVGKTLLTALLLAHLRRRGVPAVALKLFCSGGRADAELLHALQGGDLTLDEINPFYFPEPLAPLVAARRHRRSIPLNAVLDHIHSVSSRHLPLANASPTNSKLKTKNLKLKTRFLLIEGAGGLLVPLGEDYTVLDLITRLDCETIVAAPNRLGAINHTLLTIQALQTARSFGSRITHPLRGCASAASHASRIAHSPLKVVLMSLRSPDPSSASNPRVLAALLAAVPLITVPFLGSRPCIAAAIRAHAARFCRILA